MLVLSKGAEAVQILVSPEPSKVSRAAPGMPLVLRLGKMYKKIGWEGWKERQQQLNSYLFVFLFFFFLFKDERLVRTAW